MVSRLVIANALLRLAKAVQAGLDEDAAELAALNRTFASEKVNEVISFEYDRFVAGSYDGFLKTFKELTERRKKQASDCKVYAAEMEKMYKNAERYHKATRRAVEEIVDRPSMRLIKRLLSDKPRIRTRGDKAHTWPCDPTGVDDFDLD